VINVKKGHVFSKKACCKTDVRMGPVGSCVVCLVCDSGKCTVKHALSMQHLWNDTDRGKLSMEHWWNDTDNGKLSTEHWLNDTDRGKVSMEHWWNDTDRGKLSMEHWWNDTDRGKQKCWQRNVSQWHFVHQLHGLTWNRTQVVAVIGKWLTPEPLHYVCRACSWL
jgi:hypothetical protein